MPALSNTHVIYARDDLVQAYNHEEAAYLSKRRGGGGGGGGRGGGGSVSSSSGGRSSTGATGSSSSSSAGAAKGFTPGSVSGGKSVYGSSAGRGVSTPYTVTSGAFAGRQAGGGTRSGIYGNGGYGSGYPGSYTGRAGGGYVGGLGFPFIFWPIGFGAAGAYGGYYGSRELNNDTERPGGGMTQYTLKQVSTTTNASANTFALYGDLNSVDTVYRKLLEVNLVQNSLGDNFTINPNQSVQYYRGSSFALLLNGYDNMQPNDSSTDPNMAISQPLAPLPASTDMGYVQELNSTIADNVPLLENSASNGMGHVPHASVVLVLPALVVAFVLGLL